MSNEKKSIGGSGSVPTGNFNLYTGLGVLKVLTVNPTGDEYEKITGHKLPFDLKYDELKDSKDRTIRKLRFLCKNVKMDFYVFVDFFIGTVPITDKTGKKFKFIDRLGRISYFIDDLQNISPKFEFDQASARKLYLGEDVLTVFLQRLAGYDSRQKDANWIQDMKNLGLSYDNIYKYKLDPLKALLTEFADNDWYVTMLLVVNTVEKDTEKGKEIKNYQAVEINENIIYSHQRLDPTEELEASNWAIQKLIAYEAAQKAEGRAVTKNWYSITLQIFNKEQCRNYVVNDTTVVASSTTATSVKEVDFTDFEDDEDLPF